MKRPQHSFKLFTVLFLLCLSAMLAPEARAMSGAGTEEAPYLITSAEDLQAMRRDLTGHYALGADIDLREIHSWTPVGNTLDGPFSGSFDGRGHTISNLTIYGGDTKFAGLFGYLEGSVKGVTLSDVSISGGRYVGGIAGNAGVGSSITDCHVLSGSISTLYSSSASPCVGGIAGLCESNIQGCTNGAKIDSTYHAGGIAGRCAYDPITIRDCSNSGTVRGYASGGIIGCAEYLVIVENCDNLTSENNQIEGMDYAGGLIGYAASTVRASDCSNANPVCTPVDYGGKANDYYKSQIGTAGGLIGYAAGSTTMDRCANIADVYGYNYIGGIIGKAAGSARLEECKNAGSIQAGGGYVDYNYTGGIIADAGDYSSLTRCENAGKVGSAYCVVGLMHTWSNSSTISCKNTGLVGGRSSSSGSSTYLSAGGTISSDTKTVIQGISIEKRDYGGTLTAYYVASGSSVRCEIATLKPSSDYLDGFVWSSSDESIATVDQNGQVLGRKPGTAKIIVTTTGLGLTSFTTVHVSSKMSLDPSYLTLEKGLTRKLNPVWAMESGDAYTSYTWSSDSPSCVSVDSDGVVTAVSPGSATITATCTQNSCKATCRVVVIDSIVQAQSVKLSQTVLRPIPGERTQLTATVTPSNATDQAVTWESSAPEVASVSVTGVVEAVSPGEATITVRTANGLYDTCQVKVVQLSSAAFVIPDSRGGMNGTFDTTVQLVKNPGIAAFTLEVQYDAAALTPVAVVPGELLSSGTLTSNVDEASDGKLRVTWYSVVDVAGDGPAFTITWRAAEQTGSFPISLHYDQADICNAEMVEVYVNTENGTSYILDRPVGDIYHDGLVNMKDIVYFARYFNEQETLDNGQRLAADLFYDSKIDVKDLEALAQVLSEEMSGATVAALFQMDSASEPLTFTVSDAIVEEGTDTVTMTVSGGGQSTAALRFQVTPPEGMEVLSVHPSGPLAERGTFGYNSETGIVTWYSDADQPLGGELFTITLGNAEDVALPAQVRLEYSGEDFFSAGTYSDIPVSVQGGIISQPPFSKIEAATASGYQIAVTIDTNRTQPALLIAAFYQDGKMTATVMEDVLAAGEYLLDVPTGAVGQQCKVFLVDSADQAPLSPSQEAVNH